MDLSKNLVVELFFSTFESIKKRKLYLLYPAVLDLLFIVSYGFAAGFFVEGVQKSAVELLKTGKSILTSGSLIKGLLSNNESFSIILLTLAFMLVVYILYCVLQGVNWRLSKKFVNEDIKFFKYLKKFFLVNIFWFALFFFLEFLDYIRRVVSYLNVGELDASFFSIAVSVLTFIIIYFAFISYALISKYKVVNAIKKSFYLGTKKLMYFLFMYLIIFILFLIINFLLILMNKINFILMIIIGIITVLPAFTFVRVFVNLVVSKLES